MTSSDRYPAEPIKPHPQREIRRAWHWLINPSESLQTLTEQRQARLLASLTLLLAAMTSIGVYAAIQADESGGSNLPIQIALVIIFGVSYLISRTRHYLWAAALSAISIAALPFFSYLGSGDYSYANSFDSLIWTLVALVFVNLFFSTRAVAAFVLVLLASLGTLPLLVPEIRFPNIFVVLTMNLIVGTVSLLNKRNRDLQEHDRQTELRAAYRELQAMSSSLETRVADRTRDLALAAEVGFTISQVRQLDSLLAEAAELIRSRFDLYHVQIYLADAAGNNLELRAGTGSIGRALVAQGHRLLFGPGSINGLAATKKQAVVVADTRSSSTFFANRLLPDTRSELAVPLLAAGQVVGVLDLQSAQVNGLTSDNLAAFDALAGQLAIAIENATLFTEVTEARTELERQAVARTRADWSEFLDAIHRREHLGYVYRATQASTEGKSAKAGRDERILSAPISITGEPVGTIDLERATDETWTEADLDMVSAIASEVAQKIENLRLLAEAEQYRREAEEAARRLVREGWQKFAETSLSAAAGYAYNRELVVPVSGQTVDDNAPSMRRQLAVSGETIGYLDISGTEGDPQQAAGLVDAVAQQLGAHIENLRLTEQTEKALASSEQQARRLAMLNDMSQALNRAPTISEIFEIAVAHTSQILVVDQATLAMLTPSTEALEIMAVVGEATISAVGELQPILDGSPFLTAVREKRLVTSAFGNSDGQTGQTVMIAPLAGELDVFGTLSISSEGQTAFTPNDEILMLQIAAVLGATIERRRLADQVQARADRERVLRQITSRVHAAADAQSILRTAAEEVNRALGLESFVYLEAEGNSPEPVSTGTNGEHG